MSHPPSEETARAQHEEMHHSWTHYLWVWLALIVLTFSTFGASMALRHSSAPTWSHFAVALAIAFIKVGLVVAFFMHLYGSEGTNKLALGLAVMFVGVMLFFVLEDPPHRFTLLNPQRAWMIQNESSEGVEHPGVQHASPGSVGFDGTNIKH